RRVARRLGRTSVAIRRARERDPRLVRQVRPATMTPVSRRARAGGLGLVLLAVGAVADACEQPSLPVIPARVTVAPEPHVVASTRLYLAGVAGYWRCVRAELEAVRGEAAPELLRSVIARRTRAA